MKGYLLDTDVVSELGRPRPDANVVAWLKNSDPGELHLATLTVGELRRGASKLGDTRNVRDFRRMTTDVVDPFDPAS